MSRMDCQLFIIFRRGYVHIQYTDYRLDYDTLNQKTLTGENGKMWHTKNRIRNYIFNA